MSEPQSVTKALADVLKDLAATSEATAEMMATYVEQFSTVLGATELSEEAKALLRETAKPIEAFGESNLSFARECAALAERARGIEK